MEALSMCICRAVPAGDVKLYAAPDSAENWEAERYLARSGIRYERLDAGDDAEALAEMARLSGQTARPVILIGDRVFVGFSEDELEEVMP
jgi:NADH-dependent peroxiredoxin subunit F